MRYVSMSFISLLLIANLTFPLSALGSLRPEQAFTPDCGIDWDAKIDSSDGFVKVRATNTCDFSVAFTVAVYHKDGTVNRTRNYCYAAKQTGVIVIGKGDWIHRVAVENASRC